MNKKILSALLNASFVASILIVSNIARAWFYKYNLIGIQGLHFSFINLTGSFGLGGLGSFLGLAFYACLGLCAKSITPLLAMAHIPTFISYAFWRYTGPAVRVGIPLLCMALFLIHPVGYQAMTYSLFWLIPVILYPWSTKNTLACSFAATFTQHAVGSVIFAYCLPMTATQFIALIPLVMVERTIFAFGSYGIWYITQKIRGITLSCATCSNEQDYVSSKG